MPTLSLTRTQQSITGAPGSQIQIQNNGGPVAYVTETNTNSPGSGDAIGYAGVRYATFPASGTLYLFASDPTEVSYGPYTVSNPGGSSTIPLPAGLVGGSGLAAVKTILDAIEMPGSTRALAIVVDGDSKTEGHYLYQWPADTWTRFFQRHIVAKTRPGGGRKTSEMRRLATTTPNTIIGGALLGNEGVGTGGIAGQGGRLKVPKADDNGAFALRFTNGITDLSLLLDTDGRQGTLRVDVYTGNRTGQGPNAVPIPASDVAGDLAAYNTGTMYTADWADEINEPGHLHKDEFGVPFGLNRNTYIRIASGMPLTNQGAGATVVIRPGNTEQYFKAIFAQRGGSGRNYVSVYNVGEHGRPASDYFNPTPNDFYWTRKTEGGLKTFANNLRNLRKFQNFADAATNHAASDLLALFCDYTNDGKNSDAEVDALIAGIQIVRDEHVALGMPWGFVFLPVTGGQTGAQWARFRAGMKAMCEAHPLSFWIDTQAVGGLTRDELKARVSAPGFGGDEVHEGVDVNAWTGELVARAILQEKWAR